MKSGAFAKRGKPTPGDGGGGRAEGAPKMKDYRPGRLRESVIFADRENVVDRVLRLTNGRSVDVVLHVASMSGLPIVDAARAFRSGGAIALADIKGGATRMALDSDAIGTREITLTGVMTRPYKFHREAAEILGEDVERLGRLLVHEYSLDGVSEAIDVLAGNERTEKTISIYTLPSESGRSRADAQADEDHGG